MLLTQPPRGWGWGWCERSEKYLWMISFAARCLGATLIASYILNILSRLVAPTRNHAGEARRAAFPSRPLRSICLLISWHTGEAHVINHISRKMQRYPKSPNDLFYSYGYWTRHQMMSLADAIVYRCQWILNMFFIAWLVANKVRTTTRQHKFRCNKWHGCRL